MSNMFPEVYDPAARLTPQRQGSTYNPLTDYYDPNRDSSGDAERATAAQAEDAANYARAHPTATTTTVTTTGPTAEELERTRLEGLRRMNAAATLQGLMSTYGLGALMGKIDGWIQQGYEPGAIEALIRQEPEYAARFPAMKQLQAKGQSISESQYIEYEQTMAQYESQYGLPAGMLTNKDMVTKLLVNGKSPREVDENAQRASASIYQLPQEFRDTMQRYYGVDSGSLTAYFMDPDVAAPLLEKQYVSAQIGMEAWKQQINVGQSISEELYQQGITRERAAQGFEKVADQSGFSSGKGETATQGTLIDANLKGTSGARKQVERVGGSRVGAFAGGGGFMGDKQGVKGLGSSSG